MAIRCISTAWETDLQPSCWNQDGGSAWKIWAKVQPAISQTTRVCSYDRAGYGYSEARPAPRDADHITAELHSLLLQANVTRPIVLMGHSLGGLFIREYATRYPEQVVGLIFVDAVTPAWGQGKVKAPPQWFTNLGFKMACMTNDDRLVGACSWPRPGIAEPRWQLATTGLCHPKICALGPERDSFRLSGEEALPTGPYGALPVLIFSHDPARWPVKWEREWEQMQKDLEKLSTRSRRIVVKNSTHVLQIEQPDSISHEISLFIEQIRGTTHN